MGPFTILAQAISDKIGFPIDQVRLLLLLALCYPLGAVFCTILSPRHVSATTRHIFSASVGVAMVWTCFGWEILILFGVVGGSYALLWLAPATVVQRYSMVWAMGCLSAAHIYRLLTDYGGYTMDYTGPLMVHVQKITLVAYALHDGLARDESDLNADQKLQQIHKPPSLFEYICYMFNFQSALCGPSCTFKQYLRYMDGSDLRQPQTTDGKAPSGPPSPLWPTLSKLMYSLLCFSVHFTVSKYYSYDIISDSKYMSSLPSLLITSFMLGLLTRFRYYFGWHLLDSIHNASGMGFSGYDSSGNPKWDIMTNCEVMKVELPVNLRMAANDGWNITTSKWLRRVCYERVKGADPNLMSFILSAFWHGFYPGYYLMFVFFGIANEASRKLRRLIRPHFQTSDFMKRFYDIITTLVTKCVVDFGYLPFILLWLDKGLLYWR